MSIIVLAKNGYIYILTGFFCVLVCEGGCVYASFSNTGLNTFSHNLYYLNS